jgi:hypothetical protein
MREEVTMDLLSCIHVTLGAGSPSMSQEKEAVSPSATFTDWGLVRILAGSVGFSLQLTETSSTAVSEEDFILASDDKNFSEEAEE